MDTLPVVILARFLSTLDSPIDLFEFLLSSPTLYVRLYEDAFFWLSLRSFKFPGFSAPFSTDLLNQQNQLQKKAFLSEIFCTIVRKSYIDLLVQIFTYTMYVSSKPSLLLTRKGARNGLSKTLYFDLTKPELTWGLEPSVFGGGIAKAETCYLSCFLDNSLHFLPVHVQTNPVTTRRSLQGDYRELLVGDWTMIGGFLDKSPQAKHFQLLHFNSKKSQFFVIWNEFEHTLFGQQRILSYNLIFPETSSKASFKNRLTTECLISIDIPSNDPVPLKSYHVVQPMNHSMKETGRNMIFLNYGDSLYYLVDFTLKLLLPLRQVPLALRDVTGVKFLKNVVVFEGPLGITLLDLATECPWRAFPLPHAYKFAFFFENNLVFMSMNQKKIFFTFVNIVNYTCVQKFLNVLEFEDLEKATVSQNFDENFEFIFANKTEVIHYRLGNIRRFIDSKEDITPLVVSFRLYRDVLQRTTVMQVLTLFSHSLVFVLLENGFLLVFSLLTCSLLKKIRVWKSHLDFDRFTGMPFLVVSSNTNWLFIHTSEFIKVLRLSSSDAFQSPCFRRLLPPNSSRLSSNTKDDVKVAKAIQKGRVLNERRASRDFEDLVEYQSELSAYNHQAFFVNNAQNLDLTEEEILQYVCLLSMENEEFS